MTDLRGERVDEGKVWAACPNCAELRAEVERLNARERELLNALWTGQINAEQVVTRLREAVEWACQQVEQIHGPDEYTIELRRRAGEGEK